MTLLQNRSPAQLLWIIAALNLLVAIGFGSMALPSRFYHAWHPQLLCSFVLIVLSLIGGLVAEQELKQGIASERWPDALLNGPRRLSAPFYVLAVLLIGSAVVSLVIIFISDGRNSAAMWCLLYPGMSLTRLSNCLRPRATSTLLNPIEPPKPLRSEHWGTPPGPLSN